MKNSKMLSDEEILFFYKSVLFLFETGCAYSIKWNSLKIEKSMISKVHFTDDKIKQKIQNEFLYIKKEYKSQPLSYIFIKRLRNAFAHNNIMREGNIYRLYDMDLFPENSTGKKRKEKTMYGVIDHELLVNIVNELKSQI